MVKPVDKVERKLFLTESGISIWSPVQSKEYTTHRKTYVVEEPSEYDENDDIRPMRVCADCGCIIPENDEGHVNHDGDYECSVHQEMAYGGIQWPTKRGTLT